MANYIYTNDGLVNADELMHYGVPGMRWGKRKNPYAKRAVRGHAGPGRYITTKRQLAGDKRDLEALNKGQHLSVGLTKKRQAAYDARDRARLEKRIAKNEKRIAEKQAKYERKQQIKDTYKDITKKSTLGERFVYNDATRKKAAKYVVDHNMTVAEANKKAKIDALRNTAITLIGIVGTYKVAKRHNVI